MSGETTVGSIVGFLRLNITDFEAGIAKAKAMADNLDRKDVDVRVKVDTAGAAAKLGAVDAAAKKTDGSVRNLDKSTHNMGRSARFLVGVLLTVGPALIPLAAATVGLAAGLGAMGVAGVLAVVGINQEVKKGTPLGLAYTGMLQTLKGDLSTLSKTAATGVLGPFQTAVADLQRKMPTLNGLIGEFSGISGRTAGTLTTGLVAAFIALAPLARDAGIYILNLTQRFAALMSGTGVVSFGDYVRSVFPHVMQQFEAIVGAVLRLVAAFAPFGTGVLTLLGAFATAINAIPVDVLSAIATGGLAIFLGFKTFSLLSMPIHEAGVAMRFMGASTEFAATAMRGLTIAAGVIGAIIAVASIAYTAHSESVRKDQEAVNSLTDALIRGHGVIEADTVAERANALAKDGTLAAAKSLGYNLGDVTAASLGNADATARVTAHTNELRAAWAATAAAGAKSGSATGAITAELESNFAAIDKVTGATRGGVKTLDLATQAYNAYNAATKVAATGGNAQAVAVQALAAKIGTTAAALAIATAGQKTTADAAAQAAAKMYLENDAAGILKGSLDLLNGKALSAANAQNAFDSSLTNMGTHVNTTGKKITFTTNSINNMSAASVALRGQLNGQVDNLQRVVEANGGLSDSTGKARAQMITMRKQIIDNAVAHGVDRAAVTAYIDKLLKIPKKVPPTKLDVDKAAADAAIVALQARITAIKQSKSPTINANTAAGKAAIVALQAAITAIKQGKPPGVTANTRPGALVIAGLQAQITAIRQSKSPTINANTGAGRAAIAQLQAQINALKGKTITVKANFSDGTSTWGVNRDFVKKATGGEINGVGTGTSDSNLIRASKGEHMLTDSDVKAAGGHGAIYAWRKSLHGYAKGGAIGSDINLSLPGARDMAALQSALSVKTMALPSGWGGAGGMGGGGAGGASRWSGFVLMALAMLGQSSSWLPAVLHRINFESGGNPKAINLTDSNARAGHPSQGLMQTVPGTFAAYSGSFRSRGITDPFASIYAGLNYALHTYHSLAVMTRPGGYALGTNNAAPGWGMVGENGVELVGRNGPEMRYFKGGETVVPNNKLGGGTDMSGVIDQLAEQTRILRSLIPGFSTALDRQARTIQERQRVGAK